MGRLMKYELRSCWKLFVLMWLGTLVLAVLNRFTLPAMEAIDNDFVRFSCTMMIILFVLAAIAVIFVSYIYVVLRFYQSMLRGEAYLTFTVPVGIDSILWSKALCGMLLVLGSTAVYIGSLVILLSGVIPGDMMKELSWGLSMAAKELGTANIIFMALALIVLALLGVVTAILQVYLAMALGQLSNKYKLVVSVLAYIGINTVLSTVSGVVTMPAMFMSMESMEYAFNAQDLAAGIWLFLAVLFLQSVLLLVVFYLPTRYIFKNKLNLE